MKQIVQLGRTVEAHDGGGNSGLNHVPVQRDAGGRGIVFFRKGNHFLNDRHCVFVIGRLAERGHTATVGNGTVFQIIAPAQQSLRKRGVGHGGNAVCDAIRKHFRIDESPEQVVAGLIDVDNAVLRRFLHLLQAEIGQTDRSNFALLAKRGRDFVVLNMPVEESGNMLTMAAAVCMIDGNADYAAKHWEVLTTWTDYLVEKGLDPENQLCTDDFAGHFAHNTNLSIKAILGVASYGRLAEMLGKKDVAESYTTKARQMAAEWERMANDGDHYRLTFDKPGTWSQKYNLVWDKLLGLNIFDTKIAEMEIPYYLTKQNIYGLPLDSRETYTKTDWIMWTATMAPDLATFREFIVPLHKFMNETIDRVPMSDWVFTDKPNWRGFKARSVVGGYYMKMLEGKLIGNKQ